MTPSTISILLLALLFQIPGQTFVRADCSDISSVTHHAGCYESINCRLSTSIWYTSFCSSGYYSATYTFVSCNSAQTTSITTDNCIVGVVTGTETCSGSYTTVTLTKEIGQYSTLSCWEYDPFMYYEVITFRAGTVGTVVASPIPTSSSSSRSHSETAVAAPGDQSNNTTTIIIIAVAVVLSVLIISVAVVVIWRLKVKKSHPPTSEISIYPSDLHRMPMQSGFRGSAVVYSPVQSNTQDTAVNVQYANQPSTEIDSNQYIPYQPSKPPTYTEINK